MQGVTSILDYGLPGTGIGSKFSAALRYYLDGGAAKFMTDFETGQTFKIYNDVTINSNTYQVLELGEFVQDYYPYPGSGILPGWWYWQSANSKLYLRDGKVVFLCKDTKNASSELIYRQDNVDTVGILSGNTWTEKKTGEGIVKIYYSNGKPKVTKYINATAGKSAVWFKYKYYGEHQGNKTQ